MNPLSPRQLRVVELLAGGASAEEIRLRLGITNSALVNILYRARLKAGAVSNLHLVALLFRAGVLQ